MNDKVRDVIIELARRTGDREVDVPRFPRSPGNDCEGCGDPQHTHNIYAFTVAHIGDWHYLCTECHKAYKFAIGLDRHLKSKGCGRGAF